MTNITTTISTDLKEAASRVALSIWAGTADADMIEALNSDGGYIVELPSGLAAALWLCSSGASRSVYGFCADREELVPIGPSCERCGSYSEVTLTDLSEHVCEKCLTAVPELIVLPAEPTYAVWYASAGCLPDSPGPEFWGTLDECKRWVDENAEDYERPEVEHDLYSLTIEPYEPEEEEL